MDNLPMELYSVNNKYHQENYNLSLLQDNFEVKCTECGDVTGVVESRLAKRIRNAEVSVPVRTDLTKGGFLIDYDSEHFDEGNVNWSGDDIYDHKSSFIMATEAAMNAAMTRQNRATCVV